MISAYALDFQHSHQRDLRVGKRVAQQLHYLSGWRNAQRRFNDAHVSIERHLDAHDRLACILFDNLSQEAHLVFPALSHADINARRINYLARFGG